MINKIIIYIRKILRKFLCYLGFHKMRIGIGWSANYRRFDICYHCRYDEWNEDEAGWKLQNFQSKLYMESRKVYIEKTKNNTGLLSQTDMEISLRMTGGISKTLRLR